MDAVVGMKKGALEALEEPHWLPLLFELQSREKNSQPCCRLQPRTADLPLQTEAFHPEFFPRGKGRQFLHQASSFTSSVE